MLFLPAAALCCLCSALVAMAEELIQDDLTLTRRTGAVPFTCKGTNQCGGANVYWLQKKDRETFTVILHIDKNTGKIDKKYNHPQSGDFSARKTPSFIELKILRVQSTHSATYYCACHKTGLRAADDYLIFGTGTKLYVTDKQVVRPVVSVYPAAHLEKGNSSLLCLARHMFPPLVKFSWKRQKENSQWEDLTPAEGEQLELEELGHTASILLLYQRKKSKDKYQCSVKYGKTTVRVETEQEVSTRPPPIAASPAAPTAAQTSAPSADPPACPPAASPTDFVPSQYQVKLLCVLYTVLIVKSLVYCCGLSLLMILRNKGPSTNCTHAD